MHRIFQEANPDISIQNSFLLLGGIKISVYVVAHNNTQVIIPTGISDINCPDILEKYQIQFDQITSDEMLEDLVRESSLEDNLYIVPLISELINIDEYPRSNKSLKGQSFLRVSHVDLSNNRVYIGSEDSKDYLNTNILRMLNKNTEWAIEQGFVVYRINRKQLKENEYLSQVTKKSTTELLMDSLSEYTDEKIIEYPQGTKRIDGVVATSYFMKHLYNMRKYFSSLDTMGKKKFSKYVKLQLQYLRKFIVAGTDGFYRNEFSDVVSYIAHNVNNNELYKNANKWQSLALCWRKIGRYLLKFITYEFEIEAIETYMEKLLCQIELALKMESEAIEELMAQVANKKVYYD